MSVEGERYIVPGTGKRHTTATLRTEAHRAGSVGLRKNTQRVIRPMHQLLWRGMHDVTLAKLFQGKSDLIHSQLESLTFKFATISFQALRHGKVRAFCIDCQVLQVGIIAHTSQPAQTNLDTYIIPTPQIVCRNTLFFFVWSPMSTRSRCTYILRFVCCGNRAMPALVFFFDWRLFSI